MQEPSPALQPLQTHLDPSPTSLVLVHLAHHAPTLACRESVYMPLQRLCGKRYSLFHHPPLAAAKVCNLGATELPAMLRQHGRKRSVEELSSLLQNVQSSYREAKQAEKLERKRAYKAHADHRRRWENMVTFGVAVLALVGGNFDWIPALQQRFKVTAETEEVEEELSSRYLALDAKELSSILQPTTVSAQRRLQQATSFSADFSLVQWVDTLNQEKGLAPSVHELIKKRRLSIAEGQAGIWGEFTTAPSLTKSAEYKWSSRWKKAWGIAMGRTEEREVVAVPAMRQKVSLQPSASPVLLNYGIASGHESLKTNAAHQPTVLHESCARPSFR